MGPAVYILGTLTTLACALLLLRGYARSQTAPAALERPLLWRANDFEHTDIRRSRDVPQRGSLFLAALSSSHWDGTLALRIDLGQ